MCGIAGFWGPGDRDDLAAMTGALAHRGPDGEGFHVDDGAHLFLGHRRLAIIDLAGGGQPMWNEDRTVAIVFNGEIYNHRALRRELLALGHVFASDHSDTEVLVHGWEQWGEDLPIRLNGMFAFAIWDTRARRLFLARDRFGEKPLYWAARPGFFAFASELSALAQHPGVGTGLDIRALQKFFAYGYLPGAVALYTGSRRLPAGHHLTFDLGGGEPRLACYWRFRIETDEGLGRRTEADLAEELRALLAVSVERRLISDVPLGLFLSGGLDSSGVLWAAARHRPAESIESFTVGFTEPSFDESAHARRVARFFGTQHRERILDLDGARDLVPALLSRLDEPLGDASLLPTYLLSEFTRRHVAVALSGDGGDELFAGYDPFQALTPARFYDWLMPRGLHRGVRRLADLLPVSTGNMSLEFKLKRSLKGLSYPRAVWNPVWMAPLEPALAAEIFDAPLRLDDLYEEAIALWESGGAADPIDKTLEFFTNLYLTDDILTKTDRAAMMVSLEARAVFLDNDLVEFCRRLPHRWKYRNGTRKYLLKQAMAGLLPDGIAHRRKKGFGIPAAKWLRTIPPAPPLPALAGIRIEAVADRWRRHRAGIVDDRLFLWSWLSLAGVLQHADRPRLARPTISAE
jgi:asparagine synthase (glutamine-hydrolysing)